VAFQLAPAGHTRARSRRHDAIDRTGARGKAAERRVFEGSFICAPIGAEMGLSARTRETTGHCSNAGGLSAVLEHPLYSNRRIRVFAAKVVAAARVVQLRSAAWCSLTANCPLRHRLLDVFDRARASGIDSPYQEFSPSHTGRGSS